MSEVFVIADLHFGHKKLAEVRGFESTQAHDDDIVDRWNRAVRKRDVTYVLGDVFKLDRMKDLNGLKKLAMGNHDTMPIARYAEHFSKVAAYFDFDGALLSHIPVHEGQFGRWDVNVHGHLHSNILDDLRYLCVSVEHVKAPHRLRDLLRDRRHLLTRLATPTISIPRGQSQL